MQIPLHILTKKYLFWVALAVLFMMIPSPVYAIKLETVVVDSELSLDISDEGYADASYVLNIHNSDQELVSGLNINIPFLDLENLQASLNGNYLAVTSASQSEYTTLQLEFGGLAIRTNQDAKLLLQFRVPKAVSGQFGFHQLYIPGIDADYKLNTSKLVINYPASFFAPTYLSTTNVSSQSNQIEMSSLHGYLVAWGDEAVYDIHAEFSFDVSTDELALNIFSLPGKSIDQDVVFTELSDQVGTIGDLVGNLWGTIDYNEPLKEVAYTARVHRFHLPGDAEFVSTPLQGPDIPADLGQLTSDSDPVTKLRYVYNYIVDKYAPNLDNADLKFAPETDDIAAKESLHSIEYAYLLAAYAQKLEIPTRICYGYLMGVDSLGGFDAGVPIVYVQALVDGEVATLDPFLEDVTGFEMFAAPFFDRIQMGVLNPSNQFDSVLGMLTSTTLSRPQVTEIGNINQSFDYTLAVDFPPEVLSGNYYQGTLTISNDSGHVIELESVLLNNKDYLSSIVGISDNYYRLIRPVGETRLVLTGLIEEDLFSSNSRSGKVTVKPLDPVFPTKTESYTVSFKANIQLVLGLISGAVVLTLLVGFWYYKKGLRKRRLTKSYAMEQDMVPTPILEG